MIALYMSMLSTQGQKETLRTLYELYRQAMFRTARQILKDDYLAEDAVHNAFLRLLHNLDKIGRPEDSRSRNFLLILARNEALRIYGKNKKQVPAEEIGDMVPDLQNVELETESRDVRRRVYEMICSLETAYCDILLLKFYYELEDNQIAEVLGISLNNARVRMHRARTKLKEKLSEEYGHDGHCI